jgi:hypothetical protein
MASEQNIAQSIAQSIAQDKAYFNKIKTNIKKNSKNKSKCTVFMTEEEYNDMFDYYLERRNTTVGRIVPQTGYLKISDNKYIMISFFYRCYQNSRTIICKDTSGVIDPSNICFVENYSGYNDYFSNKNKYDSFKNLRDKKKNLNEILEFVLSKNSMLLKNALEILFNEISVFIQNYNEVLDRGQALQGSAEEPNLNGSAEEPNLNKNSFYNKHSGQLIQLFKDFISTRIWDYVKFQDILNKFSILIYKYHII